MRYFFDEYLAHASYLVGCQKTGEAVVIDPSRHIEPYVKVAKQQHLTLTAVAETHIHADFVSGARELADQCNTTLYVSGEGGAHWQYENLEHVDHQLVREGDVLQIGNLEITVIHTPGHTPESISLILTDTSGGKENPIGIFTGDFVFVGDVGRPDLLEAAVGIEGAAIDGAKAMFRSLERFKALPDYLQVWPAHGAGSACGKALGALPSSTVGYEKMYNWALQYDAIHTFANDLIAGQPEPPPYFSIVKQVNQSGPPLLKDLSVPVKASDAGSLYSWLKKGIVVDTRPAGDFGSGHVPGSINIPFNHNFATWAGWLIDYDKPLFILADNGHFEKIKQVLASIGINSIAGYMNVHTALRKYLELEAYDEMEPENIQKSSDFEKQIFLDVRSQEEWEQGHISGALHIPLGQLPKRLNEIPHDIRTVVYCASGSRSAIAASILQAAGLKEVVNLSGGYHKWKQEAEASI